MSTADKIALATVIAAVTPMAVYFMAWIFAAVLMAIYGEQANEQ